MKAQIDELVALLNNVELAIKFGNKGGLNKCILLARRYHGFKGRNTEINQYLRELIEFNKKQLELNFESES